MSAQTTPHTAEHGDRFLLNGLPWQFGTAAGYAAAYGDDPAEAVARAERNGHLTVWITPVGRVLSAEGRPAEWPEVSLEVGDPVRLAGSVYTVLRDGRENLRLSPVRA